MHRKEYSKGTLNCIASIHPFYTCYLIDIFFTSLSKSLLHLCHMFYTCVTCFTLLQHSIRYITSKSHDTLCYSLVASFLHTCHTLCSAFATAIFSSWLHGNSIFFVTFLNCTVSGVARVPAARGGC